MPLSTAAELLAHLRQLQLLQPAQLDQLARAAHGKQRDARTLAQQLIEQGWLTPYQVNQLVQGRGKELVLGAYVLLERLGEGGMGEVFKARHQKMQRVVAVKLIRKERLANEAAVKRFQREIRNASQLAHPNVVRAFDAAQVGAIHLFAMEYVGGVDLNKLVKEKGPLPVDQACACVRQAALGLQHAFEKGMVHRDIKPHNLLLTTDGTVKVLDFGLARMAADAEDSGTLTREGALMGTLDYVAPEQARDAHAVDIRADLYSLGCTFYFLLTGKVPFPGGAALEKLYKHGFEEARPVEQVRRDVPPGVAAVVRTLLAKKPEDRFQTPAELAAALANGAGPPAGAVASLSRGQAMAAARSVGVAGPRAAPAEADATLVSDTTPADPSSAGGRRRRLLVFGVAGLLLLCLAALSLALFRRSGTDASKAAANDAPGVLENKLGMKLRLIPPGTFLMGAPPEEIELAIYQKTSWAVPEDYRAEGPQHEIEITQPFYMGVHPVTRGQFRQFIKGAGYKIPRGASRHSPNGSWGTDPNVNWDNPGFDADDTHPVVCVNWVDAAEFVKWLNEKHPLAPPATKPGERWQYALPAEAQWEYACRAHTKTRYGCGEGEETLKGHANVADVAVRRVQPLTDWARWAVPWDDGYAFTSPVGAFPPNGWGLYDMHGNVWQWCADSYDAKYYKDSPRRDPPGPSPSGEFVVRGGSWADAPSRCRSAARDHNGSALRRDHIGFRVALVRRAAGRDRP